MKNNIIVSSAFVLLIGSFLSSLLGFLREVYVASFLGVGKEIDAYLIASTIPNFFQSIICSIFIGVFIPVYIKKRNSSSEQEAWNFISSIANLIFVSLFCIGVVFMFFSKQILMIFVNDLSNLKLVQHLTLILFLALLFYALSFMQTSILNTYNSFTIPAFLPVVNNVIVIVFIIVFSKSIGVYAIAIGYLFGTIVQLFIQYPKLKKHGFRYYFHINLSKSEVSSTFYMFLPILSITLVDQLGILISRFFASQMQTGSVAALNYATRLIMLPVTVVGASIINASYPTIINSVDKGNVHDINNIVTNTFKFIVLSLIPVITILVMYKREVVKIIFERGAFDQNATIMTSDALFYFACGIVFIVLKDFLNRLMFSHQVYKNTIIASTIFVISFVIICVVLIPHIGHISIAIANTIGMFFSFIYLLKTYLKLNFQYKVLISISYILKIISSSVVANILGYMIYRSISIYDFNEFLRFFLTIFCSLVVYIFLLKMLKIQEIDKIILFFKKKVMEFGN
ncbi:murein biosynthesis integral membrane protein MurJ [Caldibacillus debilis]|uniref:murein biosynthesis integral membrane protein MurJ n=1 Tax=Caldibacillus debilis TaxID=301148 RepID=UPI000379B372|nr:murein biosynthesis integral membrane protein MurJ [Caldibacillus debilis]